MRARVCVHVNHKVAVNELPITLMISAAEDSNCILNAKLLALLTLFIVVASRFVVIAASSYTRSFTFRQRHILKEGSPLAALQNCNCNQLTHTSFLAAGLLYATEIKVKSEDEQQRGECSVNTDYTHPVARQHISIKRNSLSVRSWRRAMSSSCLIQSGILVLLFGVLSKF